MNDYDDDDDDEGDLFRLVMSSPFLIPFLRHILVFLRIVIFLENHAQVTLTEFFFACAYVLFIFIF